MSKVYIVQGGWMCTLPCIIRDTTTFVQEQLEDPSDWFKCIRIPINYQFTTTCVSEQLGMLLFIFYFHYIKHKQIVWRTFDV